MIKNLLLLALLSWASFSYAKHPIVKESMGEAEAFKVEKPTEEQEAQRSLAGEKIKKKKRFQDPEAKDESPTTELDSEVRFWKYSE